MDRFSIDALKYINSNPKIPLNELLKNGETYIAPMRFKVVDDIYFAIENEYFYEQSSNFKETVEISLPYKVKFNMGGAIRFKINMHYTVPDAASSGGSPCVRIYVNGELKGKMYADEAGVYKTASTDIEVNKGDIVTFAFFGGLKKLSGGGAWYSNKCYIQENSLKICCAVEELKGKNRIEVSDQ